MFTKKVQEGCQPFTKSFLDKTARSKYGIRKMHEIFYQCKEISNLKYRPILCAHAAFPTINGCLAREVDEANTPATSLKYLIASFCFSLFFTSRLARKDLIKARGKNIYLKVSVIYISASGKCISA